MTELERIRADLAAYDSSHPHQTNAADSAVDDIRILLRLVDEAIAEVALLRKREAAVIARAERAERRAHNVTADGAAGMRRGVR